MFQLHKFTNLFRVGVNILDTLSVFYVICLKPILHESLNIYFPFLKIGFPLNNSNIVEKLNIFKLINFNLHSYEEFQYKIKNEFKLT